MSNYQPVRAAFSREEMIEEAKQFMRIMYGELEDVQDTDKWLERLGMLVAFVHDLFPPQK